MVNNSTKGKIFAIICTVLIAFGCSSASNLLFGDFFTFNELIPGETSQMTLMGDDEFNPVYLVSHKEEVYVTNKTNKTTNHNKTNTNTNTTVNKTKPNKPINHNDSALL